MYKNLILTLMISLMLTAGAFAQSSERGGSGSSSRASIQAERALSKEVSKLTGKMARSDFAGVKLNGKQRQTLKQLVEANYSKMTQLDEQIAREIPADKVKALQKAYRAAKREHASEKEAMLISMQSIELPEAMQQKVEELSKSKEEIMASMRAAVVDTFDAEQKSKFDAAMAEKKMAAKEEMTDEKMTDEEMSDEKMSGEKMSDEKMMDKEASEEEAMGSGSK